MQDAAALAAQQRGGKQQNDHGAFQYSLHGPRQAASAAIVKPVASARFAAVTRSGDDGPHPQRAPIGYGNY